MITNFEDQTYEITSEEFELVNVLISGFKKRTKANPIKAPEICRDVNTFLLNKRPDLRIKLTEPRLRKLCNYIRSNGLLPLIATSNGYYTSYDQQEIFDQIKSLRERASSINNSADGLQKFIITVPNLLPLT